MDQYERVIVRKPWGREYLCYRNEYVAIWHLSIDQGHRTSMHCHPNKNTGFVVLDGTIKLSFLRNSIFLEGLDKIHIFRSRFHSTLAVTDALLFEIETPDDKHDLIRLNDEYGRQDLGYESGEYHFEKDDDCIWIPQPSFNPKPISFARCEILHKTITKSSSLIGFDDTVVLIVTKGGLVAKGDKKVLWPGDVVDGKTLQKLATNFSVENDSHFLIVNRKV